MEKYAIQHQSQPIELVTQIAERILGGDPYDPEVRAQALILSAMTAGASIGATFEGPIGAIKGGVIGWLAGIGIHLITEWIAST